MKATLGLGSDKGSMRYEGMELGLSEKALSNFVYALYDVQFDVDIDEETGHYKLLEVRDGKQTLRPVENE